MTKIELTKTGVGTIEIDATKIEETITKDVISYSYPFPPAKQGIISPLQPRREALDLLNINRVFSITGSIRKECMSGAVSAPQVRDVLVKMQLYGGTLTFKYGLPADCNSTRPEGGSVSYYTPTAEMQYYFNGFSCHINRLQIVENTKGGASTDQTAESLITPGTYGSPHKMPEEYEVTIELVNAVDTSS